jgi:DNA uptake protein ComE-like DNA-binding protein
MRYKSLIFCLFLTACGDIYRAEVMEVEASEVEASEVESFAGDESLGGGEGSEQDLSHCPGALAQLVASYDYSQELDSVHLLDEVELGSVNINTATLYELGLVPGIGPYGAQLIIDNRPHTSLDGLSRLPGLSKPNLSRALPYLTL